MVERSVNTSDFIIGNRNFSYLLYLYTIVNAEYKTTEDNESVFIIDKKKMNFSRLANYWGKNTNGKWIAGDNETLSKAFNNMVSAGIYEKMSDGNYCLVSLKTFLGCKIPLSTLRWILDNCDDNMSRILCFLLNKINFFTKEKKNQSFNLYLSNLYKKLGYKSSMTKQQRTQLEAIIEYFSAFGFFDYSMSYINQYGHKTRLFHFYNVNFSPEVTLVTEYTQEIFGDIDEEKYFDKETKVLLELPNPKNYNIKSEYEQEVIKTCSEFLEKHDVIPARDYNTIRTQVKNIAYKKYMKDWIVKINNDSIILERYV